MAQKPTSKPNNNKVDDSENKPKYEFPLGKKNYIIMACAAICIILGFVLISGGATTDGSFNEEVFSTTRIVVGPTLAFLGFVAMGVGIMKK